jgi:hypothetical protein
MRTGVLEEYQAAVKTTISKRRQIERLKASSNIRPERVDEALEDIEEVSLRALLYYNVRSDRVVRQASTSKFSLGERRESPRTSTRPFKLIIDMLMMISRRL